jgi:hypothetical protein
MEFDNNHPFVETPSVPKNCPEFTSVYNFIKPDLVVFKGKLHLCFHCKEHEGISKFAYCAYCKICDDTFPYNTSTNPHTVTSHACQVHGALISRMCEEQLERELADAKLKASFRINKQTTLSTFANSEASKFLLASRVDLDKF